MAYDTAVKRYNDDMADRTVFNIRNHSGAVGADSYGKCLALEAFVRLCAIPLKLDYAKTAFDGDGDGGGPGRWSLIENHNLNRRLTHEKAQEIAP